jgi:hypothetical protein
VGHWRELQKVRNKRQKHGPEISGSIGNCKPQNTKLMEKKRMWDKVKCIAKIQIRGISSSLESQPEEQ